MDRSMDSLCTVDGRSLRRWPRRVTYAVPVCHESDACSPATGELIEQRSRLTQRLTLSQLFSGKITEAANQIDCPDGGYVEMGSHRQEPGTSRSRIEQTLR